MGLNFFNRPVLNLVIMLTELRALCNVSGRENFVVVTLTLLLLLLLLRSEWVLMRKISRRMMSCYYPYRKHSHSALAH